MTQTSKRRKYKMSQDSKRPEVHDWIGAKHLGLWDHICELPIHNKVH
jgi:hypothetical protein